MGFIGTFKGSFFSDALYRHVRYHGRGHGFIYALWLVAMQMLAGVVFITGLLLFGAVASDVNPIKLADAAIRQTAAQWPAMRVHADGTVDVHAQQPHHIVIDLSAFAPKPGKELYPFITIDTTGAVTASNFQAPILITRDTVVIRDDKETKIRPLSEFTQGMKESRTITNPDARRMGEDLIAWVHAWGWLAYIVFAALLWAMMTALFFLMRLCMLFALGLAGKLIGEFFNKPVTYETATRMASVAYTPVAVLDMVALGLLGTHLSWLVLLLLGTSSLMLAFHASDR